MLSPMQQVLADLRDAARFVNKGLTNDANDCLLEAVNGLRKVASSMDKAKLDEMPLEADAATISALRKMAKEYKQFEDEDHRQYRIQAGLADEDDPLPVDDDADEDDDPSIEPPATPVCCPRCRGTDIVQCEDWIGTSLAGTEKAELTEYQCRSCASSYWM